MAPEGLRRALEELGRALLTAARSAASADRYLASHGARRRPGGAAELASSSARSAEAATQLERQIAELDALAEERGLLHDETRALQAAQAGLAASVAGTRGEAREVVAELYRRRDLIDARTASLDRAYDEAVRDLGGAALRLPWRARLEARRQDRRLARLEKMVSQEAESGSFIGTKRWHETPGGGGPS